MTVGINGLRQCRDGKCNINILKEEGSCDSAAIHVGKVEESVEEWQELVAQEQSLPHSFHRSLVPHCGILVLG